MNEIPQELSGIIFCYELLKLIDLIFEKLPDGFLIRNTVLNIG